MKFIKNMRKLKKNNFLKYFLSLEKDLLKIRDKLWTLLKIWDTSINAKIRNFKNEKILNFLIDFLIESGPDP